uniref:Uncharacterized protein n=1 Tax=Picea sitchensis TaxID=3332 RepID=A9NJT5_PICSI|nr:unknown [Picea sitchensis]
MHNLLVESRKRGREEFISSGFDSQKTGKPRWFWSKKSQSV